MIKVQTVQGAAIEYQVANRAEYVVRNYLYGQLVQMNDKSLWGLIDIDNKHLRLCPDKEGCLPRSTLNQAEFDYIRAEYP